MHVEPGKIVVEEVTDPVAIAKWRNRQQRADRNWSWFESHAAEIYDAHRGKCVCVAGEELFVADTGPEAFALAAAVHPEDDARLLLYIPWEKMERIYAPLRTVAPLL